MPHLVCSKIDISVEGTDGGKWGRMHIYVCNACTEGKKKSTTQSFELQPDQVSALKYELVH